MSVYFADGPKVVGLPPANTSPAVAESPTNVKAIEGSIPTSGLRATVGRLLMHAATALGLDTHPTQASANNRLQSNGVEGENSSNLTPSFSEQLRSSLFEFKFFHAVFTFGGTVAGLVISAWNYLTRNTTEQIYTRVVQDVSHQNYTPLAFETPASDSDSRIHQPVVLLEVSTKTDEKKVDIFTLALEQAAEAWRHKREETEAERADQDDRNFRERLRHARSVIEAIDARGGTTANNPKVQAILASLGTPYDSIQYAISLVEALQAEERDDKSQLQ